VGGTLGGRGFESYLASSKTNRMALAKIQYSFKRKLVSKEEFRRQVPNQSEEYLDIIIRLCQSINPEKQEPWTLTMLDTGGFHFEPDFR
jgi:hypothetical protein